MQFKRKRIRFYVVLGLVLLVTQFVGLTALGAPQKVEAASANTLTQYITWMQDAKRLYPYPQTLDKMYRVMMCESTGNARASGGGGLWLGLIHYAPTTWRASWNPYRTSSIWD